MLGKAGGLCYDKKTEDRAGRKQQNGCPEKKGVRMTMHNLGEVRTALAAGELDEALARLMCGDPAPGRQRVTQLLDGLRH